MAKLDELERALISEVILYEDMIRDVDDHIGEMPKLASQILSLRVIKALNWAKIAKATDYSVRQCQRIYSTYSEKVFVKGE